METLQKFKTFFDEINVSNSKNYKLDILRRYQNDEDIKYYLHYLFSPYTITGISDKKLFKQFSLSAGLLALGLEHTEIHSFKDCLNYALKERTGSAGVVLILQTYINNHIDKELWPFACGLITKSLNLGVDAKSINKVIPGLIPTEYLAAKAEVEKAVKKPAKKKSSKKQSKNKESDTHEDIN